MLDRPIFDLRRGQTSTLCGKRDERERRSARIGHAWDMAGWVLSFFLIFILGRTVFFLLAFLLSLLPCGERRVRKKNEGPKAKWNVTNLLVGRKERMDGLTEYSFF